MKAVPLVLIALLLAGCMSNDEVIAATKKCEDAGMDAQLMVGTFHGWPMDVQCQPRTR